MQRNFEYLEARLDAADGESPPELATLLEDAIDIHDRHWKIHWMLNFAQLSATLNLRAVMEQVRGAVDEELLGRLQNSASDRNWDSIEALWRMKNEVRDDPELRAAFGAGDAKAIAAALRATDRGRRFIDERVTPYQREFGWHAVWSHEFIFPTVREEMEPMLELVRGYVETDYDYPSAIDAMRRDIEAASNEILEGLEGEALEEMRAANATNLRMAPLTPDHHFYIDQGANAHVRLVLIAIGRKLVEDGRLDRPDDVLFLRYNELRVLIGDPAALDARGTRGAAPRRTRRARRGQAARLGRHRHPDAARVPVPRQLGLSRSSSTAARPTTTTGQGDRRLPGRGRGDRARRDDGGRIRRRQRRRHPGVPDDEPGVGRAVHEDRRARDRHRRDDVASGRAVREFEIPAVDRHVDRHARDPHRRPDPRRRFERRGGDPAGRRGRRPDRQPDRLVMRGHGRLRNARAERPRRPGQGTAARAKSSPAAMHPTRGSSRRRSPASSARARHRSARRSVGSRRWASSRSPRSVAPACAGRRPDASCSRRTPSAPSLEALGARLAVPRLSDDDLAELAEHADAMQAGGPGGGRPRGRRGRRSVPRPDRRDRRQRDARQGVAFARAVLAHVHHAGGSGADPQWSADLHTPILQALMARDTDAVVAALERHFADVAANMARRLPDRTEDETPA